MNGSRLATRRIHIAGSISDDPAIAPLTAIEDAREMIRLFVAGLITRGAGLVVPLGEDPRREADGAPCLFDWLVLEAVETHLTRRPRGALFPTVIAVKHHKTRGQLLAEHTKRLEALQAATDAVQVVNVGQWNMNAMRLETQAQYGDILVTLGGDEGVIHLANLYRQAGKPVIPLDYQLTTEHRGARELWRIASPAQATERFFRLVDGMSANDALDRLALHPGTTLTQVATALIELLERLAPPTLFGVRLLNPTNAAFQAVDDFFTGVVTPVAEGFGYQLTVVDGGHSEAPLVTQDIFQRLHFSRAVVADLTGVRPNCCLELGYALGRGRPTLLTAQQGSDLPFDAEHIATHFWDATATLTSRREAFRRYWLANIKRPSLVSTDLFHP